MENTAALIEGLGLSSKAIYMPSIMRDGDQQALIPLEKNENFSSIKEILPDRLIVRYGQNPDDLAISVTTPGSISLDWYETIPGPSAGEIEFTINHVLSEVVKIADSASVILADDRIYIAVSNPKPVFEDTWYYQCMGSPIASIIAAVSSEALGKPVRIFEEDFEKTLSTITLEVLS